MTLIIDPKRVKFWRDKLKNQILEPNVFEKLSNEIREKKPPPTKWQRFKNRWSNRIYWVKGLRIAHRDRIDNEEW